MTAAWNPAYLGISAATSSASGFMLITSSRQYSSCRTGLVWTSKPTNPVKVGIRVGVRPPAFGSKKALFGALVTLPRSVET